MKEKIIRTEVQVTPKIDLGGSKKYYWRVLQIVDGEDMTIDSGFKESFLSANSTSYEKAKRYVDWFN